MNYFELWKGIHMACAFLSISGLLLRAWWMFSGSLLFEHRLRKILPHIVDTLLLLSAIMMLFVLGLNPFQQAWLLAKIVALLAYILSGIFLFRFAKSRKQQLLAFFSAIVFASYIVQTAFTKNPWLF